VALFFLVVYDLADRIHRLADAAANAAFGILGLALGFQMAIAERLTGFLFNRAGCFLQAAFDSLSIDDDPPYRWCCDANIG